MNSGSDSGSRNSVREISISRRVESEREVEEEEEAVRCRGRGRVAGVIHFCRV